MTEKTNRNIVRAAIAQGGWVIAYGDLVNEFDVLTGAAAALTGTMPGWVAQQVNDQVRKFNQSLNSISPDVLKQAIDFAKDALKHQRSEERDVSGLGIKAGIATYNRHLKLPFGGKLKLPNNHQPYIGVRITKSLPPRTAADTADFSEYESGFDESDDFIISKL